MAGSGGVADRPERVGLRIVDAQVHAWERDHPGRPWDPTYAASGPVAAANLQRQRGREMKFPRLLDEMARVGVDAAVIVTPSVYGYDNSYPLEGAATHPTRFAVVGRLDLSVSDLDERVAEWRSTPGALGLRSVVTSEAHMRELRSGAVERLFSAAERHGVPVFIFWPHDPADLARSVEGHPRLMFVIDHLGIAQPPLIRIGDDPFAGIAPVLALARYPNVAVKLSGAPTLSREPFPFRDVWPHVHRVLSAFGTDRVMWGSDFTRVAELHTYEEAIGFVRETSELSSKEKEQLLGGTLRKLLGWPPDLST